ncbi:putative HTH-type transcriptional regulator, lysR family [Sulfitobacter noctilucicola]|uniref:DNA-binding transcriptional LysR family regulator n=1 Tax=Sulfitobacter noctilucicola TaxID=1342301 RepID=A0A7W6MDB2_9RHOB|nr:LysR family transcriptional regulator [Sulfitobacter noctilucicola]KIN70213.1 putative HTH-type transcriptional regulator, lysR family [Sulfitobacter noctilucicola]MBB4176117.1 DNA-binding transcriptional LysR family regulator [Sulfitobacter noctilucicola]
MDITLIKTFIEVANTGSFVAACDRLFVTQSAVSLRIQRLEDSLGHPLFHRSKAGAILTPEGRQFERYALSLLKIWEEARQQIAIPEGYSRALSIGAQYSLWPRLGFRWIDAMQAAMPELSVHCEVGMTDRITRFLIEGVIQAGILYTPQLRPGLIVEPAIDDELILVASYPDATLDIKECYVAIDWGPEFTHALAIALPELTDSGRSMALGSLAMDYIVNRRAAGFVPARSAKRYLDAGKLHIVSEAPRFPYPAWVIWRDDMPEDLAQMARRTLNDVVQAAEKEQKPVTDSLETMENFEPVRDERITNE